MQHKCAHNLHAPGGVLRVFIFMLRPQLMQVACAIYELRYFGRGKIRRPPIWPHTGIKMAQVLGTPVYIYVVDPYEDFQPQQKLTSVRNVVFSSCFFPIQINTFTVTITVYCSIYINCIQHCLLSNFSFLSVSLRLVM